MESGQNSRIRGLGFGLLAFALFSTHDAIIKALGDTYSVFQVIFFALMFAFAPMTVLVLADHAVGNFRPRHPWLVLSHSVLSLIVMSGSFYAFVTLPLAEVYALLFTIPLLITALSVSLLGETVRVSRWVAVIVGLIGVMIVLRPGATSLSLGHLMTVLAVFASALAKIIVRKIGGEERPAVLVLYAMLTSLVVMGAILPAVYVPVELPSLGLMAAVGLISVTGQLCTIAAYRFAPAAVVAPTQYSQILWGTGFGIVLFSEHPDWSVATGACVIIASGIFIFWREIRKNVPDRNAVPRTPDSGIDA